MSRPDPAGSRGSGSGSGSKLLALRARLLGVVVELLCDLALGVPDWAGFQARLVRYARLDMRLQQMEAAPAARRRGRPAALDQLREAWRR